MYKPKMYYKDIFSINYETLKQKGIKCLLFDIDNTMARVDEKVPKKEVIELINKLKKDFKVIILSNALYHRVKKFKKTLGIDGYYFSCKPHQRIYKKVLKECGFKSDEIAAIGDQLCTDIKGANRIGITSILVDQISKKEFITTKVMRIKEKGIIKRDKVIKRGVYDE